MAMATYLDHHQCWGEEEEESLPRLEPLQTNCPSSLSGPRQGVKIIILDNIKSDVKNKYIETFK